MSKKREKNRWGFLLIVLIALLGAGAAGWMMTKDLSKVDGRTSGQQESRAAEEESSGGSLLMYERTAEPELIFEENSGETYLQNEFIVFYSGNDADTVLDKLKTSSGGDSGTYKIIGRNGYDGSVLLHRDGDALPYDEIQKEIERIKALEGVSDVFLNYAVLPDAGEENADTSREAGTEESSDQEPDTNEAIDSWNMKAIGAQEMVEAVKKLPQKDADKKAFSDIGVINTDQEQDKELDRVIKTIYPLGNICRAEYTKDIDCIFALNLQLSELMIERNCRVLCFNVDQPLLTFAAAQVNREAENMIILQNLVLYRSLYSLERYISEHEENVPGCVICCAAGDHMTYEYESFDNKDYGFDIVSDGNDSYEKAMSKRDDWDGCNAKWSILGRIQTDAKKQKALDHIRIICAGSVGEGEEAPELSLFSQTGYPAEVLAPGERIWDSSDDAAPSGTVLAAAHTAGVAADILALKSKITPKECTDCIREHLQTQGKFKVLLNCDGIADSLAQDGDGKTEKKANVQEKKSGWKNENGKACYYYSERDTGKTPGEQAKDFTTTGGIYIPESGSIDGELGETYALAIDALDQVGWNLQSAYQYAGATDYANYEELFDLIIQKAAYAGFKKRAGNCVAWASEFCVMGILLGYDTRQVWGFIGKGDDTPHSWVEIHEGDDVRVFDPRHEQGLDSSGFDIRYGQKGTFRYDESRITYMKMEKND